MNVEVAAAATSDPQKETRRFCRQYQQRLDLRLLTWPGAETLSDIRWQRQIWEAIDEMRQAAPYATYDLRFLKELMGRIEEAVSKLEDPDILNSFAEYSAELFARPPSPTDARDAYIWARYTLPDGGETIREAPLTIDLLENPRVLAAAGCTGHRTWEAALHLASLLACSPAFTELVAGKRVLELGAGTGLVSLVCCAVGALSVKATDGDEGAVLRLEQTRQRNVMRSGIGGSMSCHTLLWGAQDELTEFLDEVDVVVAADVTYDPAALPDLVHTLGALLSRRETTAIVAATLRNQDTLRSFEIECRAAHLDMHRLVDEALQNDGRDRRGVGEQDGLFHEPVAEIVLMRLCAAE